MESKQKILRRTILNRIFKINSDKEFEEVSLLVFNYQFKYNLIYKNFIESLNINIGEICNCSQIPYLPIELFKFHDVVSFSEEPEIIFKSSGTSGSVRSKHKIYDLEVYHKSLLNGFQYFYDEPGNYIFLSLLPNYLEVGDSSLVYMMKKLIEKSNQVEEGFYLNNFEELYDVIINNNQYRIFLIGVSYALLDFAEKFQLDLSNPIIMETGGMKGRKKEMVREELHNKLKKSFNAKTIHSEYSMTELMSQAYSKENGFFNTPPWMKILIRDIQDPLTIISDNLQGGINIIDLANIDSCSFIATQDIGTKYSNGTFDVIGRFDNSDIRGCNLMFS